MQSEYIEQCDGGYYVAGTRISLDSVVYAEHEFEGRAIPLERANPALWAKIRLAKAQATQSSRRFGVGDPEVLGWAAREHRVLVSHDRRTMLRHFREHLSVGKNSPGLLVVSQDAEIGPVVEALVIVWSMSHPSEFRDQAHCHPSPSFHSLNLENSAAGPDPRDRSSII